MLRSLPDTESGMSSAQLAMATGTLGRRLADLGRASEALAATHTAVALRRQLAETDGEPHIPELASELCTLCREQTLLGRDADARAAAEEAVSLLRRLTEVDADPRLGDLAYALRQLGQLLGRAPDRIAEALLLTGEAVAIRRELHKSDSGRHQVALAAELYDLSQLLSIAGRGEEALPLTDEALAVARALPESATDPRRSRLLMLTSMGYIWVRTETGRELPEALARLDEVEYLLRLPPPGHELRGVDFTDIGHVLELRAHILTELGRPEEAMAARRAVLAQKSADKLFLGTLDPAGHLVRRLFGLIDMAEVGQSRGAEALAVRIVTAEQGSWERAWAKRLLRLRLKRENRVGRERLPRVRIGPPAVQTAPSAASLLADITAFEAIETTRSTRSCRSSAQELVILGDPRGIDILVAQTLDSRLKRFHRKEAARALIEAGDPRGRYLLADLLAEQAADTGVSRRMRRSAADALTALDDPRGEELPAARATGGSAELTSRQEIGWPLTARADAPDGVLNGVSADAVAALRQLPALRVNAKRARNSEQLARCLAAVALPWPAAFALLVGEAVAEAGGSRPGPGNWIALCVSAALLYLLTIEFTGQAARFTAKAFGVSPDAQHNLIGCYVLLMPVLAGLGYVLAHPLLGFLQATGKLLWNILIWR